MQFTVRIMGIYFHFYWDWIAQFYSRLGGHKALGILWYLMTQFKLARNPIKSLEKIMQILSTFSAYSSVSQCNLILKNLQAKKKCQLNQKEY
jgi:hypothetical protein